MAEESEIRSPQEPVENPGIDKADMAGDLPEEVTHNINDEPQVASHWADRPVVRLAVNLLAMALVFRPGW